MTPLLLVNELFVAWDYKLYGLWIMYSLAVLMDSRIVYRAYLLFSLQWQYCILSRSRCLFSVVFLALEAVLLVEVTGAA